MAEIFKHGNLPRPFADIAAEGAVSAIFWGFAVTLKRMFPCGFPRVESRDGGVRPQRPAASALGPLRGCRARPETSL
jgi:hypothetical protein